MDAILDGGISSLQQSSKTQSCAFCTSRFIPPIVNIVPFSLLIIQEEIQKINQITSKECLNHQIPTKKERMSIFICLPSLKCKANDQIPLLCIKSIKVYISSKISRSVIRDKITQCRTDCLGSATCSLTPAHTSKTTRQQL